MNASERLKIIRGDLTQAEFAAKLGIHKNTLGRYERGESEPDFSVCVNICLDKDFREVIAENRQLHREKEEILRENGVLREKIARLEERKSRLAVASDQSAQNSGVA